MHFDGTRQRCARPQAWRMARGLIGFAMLSRGLSAVSQVGNAPEDDASSTKGASSACSSPTFLLDKQPEFGETCEDDMAPDLDGAQPCQAQSVPCASCRS